MRRMGLYLLCVCVLLASVGCTRATKAPKQSEVVLIDPGHGGFDGGAVAEDGTVEKHINLAIAQYLYDLLYVCGVPVSMTRWTDTGLEEDAAAPIRQKKVTDMHRRLELYQQSSVVISLHQNHFSVPKYNGTQLFYSTNHPDSARLAQAIRASVIGWVQPQNTREIKPATDGVYLLYHSEAPAVLVECGFLSNPEERERLKKPAYQQQLAFAVIAGYWKYKQK